MGEMPTWPDKANYMFSSSWTDLVGNRVEGESGFDETSFKAASYDAAMARLYVAVALLEQAEKFIHGTVHGDNCYVSNHYDGDPGNRCNCGKEAIEEHLSYQRAAIGPLPPLPPQPEGEK